MISMIAAHIMKIEIKKNCFAVSTSSMLTSSLLIEICKLASKKKMMTNFVVNDNEQLGNENKQ